MDNRFSLDDHRRHAVLRAIHAVGHAIAFQPDPPTLHPSPFTLYFPPLVASGLRPMTERPQLPALADPSPNLRNSPLRLVIGEAPDATNKAKSPSAVPW